MAGVEPHQTIVRNAEALRVTDPVERSASLKALFSQSEALCSNPRGRSAPFFQDSRNTSPGIKPKRFVNWPAPAKDEKKRFPRRKGKPAPVAALRSRYRFGRFPGAPGPRFLSGQRDERPPRFPFSQKTNQEAPGPKRFVKTTFPAGRRRGRSASVLARAMARSASVSVPRRRRGHKKAALTDGYAGWRVD